MGVLGSSWGVLGWSWGGLGRSWGALGGVLERSCGALKATLGAVKFLIVFWIDFGRQKGAQREAFWEPKRSQNRSQNEVEIQERKSCVLESTWVDFGSFWEGPWKAFLLIFYWFLYYFVEIDLFEQKSSQDLSWTDLGPIWVPKRVQNGGRRWSKSEVS